jgi:hypothetical protein
VRSKEGHKTPSFAIIAATRPISETKTRAPLTSARWRHSWNGAGNTAGLATIDPITVAAYVEQIQTGYSKPTVKNVIFLIGKTGLSLLLLRTKSTAIGVEQLG